MQKRRIAKSTGVDGADLKSRVLALGLLVGSLWVIEVLDYFVFDQSLNAYGIRPRVSSLDSLWRVLLAPFLHRDYDHLIANTVPILVLGWFVLLRGVGQLVEVTVLTVIIGGGGTWLIGAAGSVHIGASILVFGFFGYLLLRGLIERSLGAIVISVVVGLLYGGLLWGVLPSQPDVSWEGHMCGFIAGGLAAWIGVKMGRKRS